MFELYTDNTNRWRFRFVNPDGKPLMASVDNYTTEKEARKELNIVLKAATQANKKK